MLNEAALEAVRRDGTEVTQADVYNAVDRVLQVGAAAGGIGDAAPMRRTHAGLQVHLCASACTSVA